MNNNILTMKERHERRINGQRQKAICTSLQYITEEKVTILKRKTYGDIPHFMKEDK